MNVCFFSNENMESLMQEQYSIQDINILNDLGYKVVIATSFKEIQWNCDFYFSWWASGSILPLIKAKIKKKPIIVVAGGNEAMYYKDSITNIPLGYLATPWYKKIATFICLKYSTRILVVSNFMVNDVKLLGAKNPIVVHNSIDIKKFYPSNVKREFITSIFKLDNSVIKIKRGDIFIASIKFVVRKFKDQHFVIIGEKGNSYKSMKKLVEENNIQANVSFVGSIPNAEVVKWLQKSIAYVQISDTETFGVAVAEAMSCGTPVVVSKRGAIPEVVGNCGIFVNHNDPKSVSDGILELLDMDENSKIELGNKCRRRIVENFSYEQRKLKIEKIIFGIKNDI